MAYTFKHGDRPVDGYTIQRAVGRGGFGEVYYAISDGGREVAIKYLRDNPQIELRGVSLVINLKSPHLVSIFDVKKTEDDDYAIIMEYCSGPSLRDLLIAEPSGFAPEKAAFFLREIGKGLAYLHDHGIVHRDLKPGNIFFDDTYVKIGDYGLSKIISVSRHSAQTASVGTVHYMAPEIGSGNYSRGVDIYALGVMLYEMLLGAVPFEGSTMAEVLMKHLTSQPELDRLPKPFAKVVRKALEKDPNDRYQTVDEMVEELLSAAEIQKSVAGFSAKSLQNAVAQAGGAKHASPRPSPNPMPRAGKPNLPPYAVPIGSRGALTGKAKKRMDRIARKVERKRAKLAGRRPNFAAAGPQQQYPPPSAEGQEFLTKRLRRRRILLTGIMGAVLSVGLGIVCATTTGVDEVGGTAGMLIPALTLGIAFGRKSVRWFGIEEGPKWAARMIRVGCAAPLLAAACAPVMDRYGHDGVAVWVAMSLVAMLFNWNRTIDESVSGEMSYGRAIWTGFAAFIVYAIVAGIMANGPEEDIMFALAGAAGITSLILQASSWWLVPVGAPRGGFAGDDDDGDNAGPGGGSPAPQGAPLSPENAETIALERRPGVPGPRGASQAEPTEVSQAASPEPRVRWGLARCFWGVVLFMTIFGSTTTFIFAVAGTGEFGASAYHTQTGLIIACIGLACASIFAVRKTTTLKRDGFWLESLRPLMQSLAVFAVGMVMTSLAREWNPARLGAEQERIAVVSSDSPDEGICWQENASNAASMVVNTSRTHYERIRTQGLSDGEKALIFTGLVLTSILYLLVRFFTRRRYYGPDEFLLAAALGTKLPVHPPGTAGGRVVAVGDDKAIDPLASDEIDP